MTETTRPGGPAVPGAPGGSVRVVRPPRGPDELAVVLVGNGEIELALLPGLGGRLVSLRCGGAELLWRNPEYLDDELRTVRPRSRWRPLDGTMGSWANVGGSKTWPAPQGWSGPGEWPGPPDPVLDSGPWALTYELPGDGSAVVRLVSPDDPASGLRVTRELVVPPAGTAFRQRDTFTNVSRGAVRWSIWEVCQVDTSTFAGPSAPGGAIEVAVAGRAEPVSMVEADGRVPVGPAAGGTRSVGVADVVAKVGFVDATGLVRLRRPDGAGLELAFAVDEAATYPDGGCRVELWMQYPTAGPIASLGGLHPSARLVELEALSPLHELAPGESRSLDLTWTAWGPSA